MPNPAAFSPRWNIFARELEAILAAHNWKLGYLDDRGIVYHREKVRRLQKSLTSPGHLVTLNPEEMERLTNFLQLTDLEKKRLNASLLATAVEMTLLDRVGADTAFRASEDVFNVLFAAMRANPTLAGGIKGGTFIDDGDDAVDAPFTRALTLIDRALLALYLSQGAPASHARHFHAQQARDAFAQALKLLQDCRDESQEWRYWYNEAENGRRMAQALLPSEGETR